MTTERPKIQYEGRVVVVARPDDGKTKSVTLYGTTPEEVIAKIEEVAGGGKDKPSNRRKAS